MFGKSKALNRIAASITAEDICNPFAFGRPVFFEFFAAKQVLAATAALS
jgi:hypothetical protein